MEFSEKILMLRKERGLSQEELAEHLAVTRQAISRWESGITMPDAPNLLKISDLFGVSVDWLLRQGEERFEEMPDAEEPSQRAAPAAEKGNRKIPHLLCGFLWIIAAGCMVTAGTLSGEIYHVAIAFVNACIACGHFFAYFHENGAFANSPWHTMKKETRQQLISAVLFFFAALCFFLAGAIGGNWLFILAGMMELAASLAFFRRCHKSAREEKI